MEPITTETIYNGCFLKKEYSGRLGSRLSQRLLQIALYNLTYQKPCSMSKALLTQVNTPITKYSGYLLGYSFRPNKEIIDTLKILPKEVGEILKEFNQVVYELQYSTTDNAVTHINKIFLIIKQAILEILKATTNITYIKVKEYKSDNLQDSKLVDARTPFINFIHLINTEAKTEGLFWTQVPYVTAPVIGLYWQSLKQGKSLVKLFNTLTGLKKGRKFAFAADKTTIRQAVPTFYLIIALEKEFNFSYRPIGFRQLQHTLKDNNSIKAFDRESGYVIFHLRHTGACILSTGDLLPVSISLLKEEFFPHAHILSSLFLTSRVAYKHCFGDNNKALAKAAASVIKDYDNFHNYIDYVLLLSTSNAHINVSDSWGRYIKSVKYGKDFKDLEKINSLIIRLPAWEHIATTSSPKELSQIIKNFEIEFNKRDFVSDWNKHIHRSLADSLLLPFLEYYKKTTPNTPKIIGKLARDNFKLFKRNKSFYKGFIPLFNFYRINILSHLDAFVATQKRHQIVLVGVGSIGSYIYPMLLKLFKRLPNQYFQLLIYDNDKVEQHNLLNQNFEEKHISEFKTTAISDKYKSESDTCKNINIRVFQKNLNLASLCTFNNTLIISAVDTFFRRSFADMEGDNALIDIRCFADTAKMVVIGAARESARYKPYDTYGAELHVLETQLENHPVENIPTHPALTEQMANRCYEAILGNFVEDGTFNINKQRESRCVTTVVNKETTATTHTETYTKF